MVQLFRRKKILKNVFRTFRCFVVTEINSQTENISGLTKKTSLVSENDLYF
jgi:hypothetical protein